MRARRRARGRSRPDDDGARDRRAASASRWARAMGKPLRCQEPRWQAQHRRRTQMTQAVLLLAVLAMAGCASMGPGAVTRDRFDSTAGLQPAAAQVQPPKPQPPEKHYEAARAALMGGDRAKAL